MRWTVCNDFIVHRSKQLFVFLRNQRVEQQRAQFRETFNNSNFPHVPVTRFLLTYLIGRYPVNKSNNPIE